jgi:hypothetical protein
MVVERHRLDPQRRAELAGGQRSQSLAPDQRQRAGDDARAAERPAAPGVSAALHPGSPV